MAMRGHTSCLILELVLLLVCCYNHVEGLPGDLSSLKAEVRAELEPIKSKLKVLQDVQPYLNTQLQQTERQIEVEFEKLHQILRNEESARINALKAEKDLKRLKLDDRISTLLEKIRDVEKSMAADDVTFLQNYMNTVLRAQDTERFSALIDVAKHLGNLKFNLLEKMKSTAKHSPVILNPNTAHPTFIMSDDLTGLRTGATQQLPDLPGRFNPIAGVLGSEGFTSGTHSWEVDVGDSDGWVAGVWREHMPRKGEGWGAMRGRWYVYYGTGQYGVHSPPQSPIPFTVNKKIKRIRVDLDCDAGKVTFSYPDDNTVKQALPLTCAEKLFPYMSASSLQVLKA